MIDVSVGIAVFAKCVCVHACVVMRMSIVCLAENVRLCGACVLVQRRMCDD